MALWGGAVLIGTGSLFQFLAYASGRDAKALKSAKKLHSIQSLFASELLASLPLYVAVRGRVATDAPLSSSTSPDDQGVIFESVTEQHFLKQTEAGEWIRDAVTMSHVIREAPWYLTDRGAWVPKSTKLWIVGANSAEGLQLATVFDLFDATPKGMLSASIDYLRGVKILGVRRTERALHMDTPLTAIGQVSVGEGGRLELKQPHGGKLPFYLSSKSLEELIDSLGVASRTCVAISAVCTGLGVALVLRRAWEAFFTRRRVAAAATARKQALQAAAARGEGDGDGEGAGPAGVVPSTELCVVCLTRPYDVVFKECGHMATCSQCARGLARCPMCRRPGQHIRVYRP